MLHYAKVACEFYLDIEMLHYAKVACEVYLDIEMLHYGKVACKNNIIDRLCRATRGHTSQPLDVQGYANG